MDDNGMIDGINKVGGNGRIPRKPTHTIFVDHKAHVEKEGIELATTNTRVEHSVIEQPWPWG